MHNYILKEKKYFFLLFVINIAFSFANAQVVTLANARKKAFNLFEEADKAQAYGKYNRADTLLREAIDIEKNFIDAHWLLGNICLDNQRKYQDAITELEIVKKLNDRYNNLLFMKLGYAYFNAGKYDDAKKYFEEFSKIKGIPPDYEKDGKNMIKNCDFAKNAVANPVFFKPENLGSGVNTAEDDLMPICTADEHFLYFTRLERIGRYHDENIFVSEWRGGSFSEAQPLPETVNTLQYNEGAHCISPSGRYLFFTSCDRPDKIGGCDLYFSKHIGTEWDRAKNMGTPLNSPSKETQPCLAADGKTLYFVSSRPNGYGAGDIYVSTLGSDGAWSEPQNLGSNINTEMEEERPFIHPDGFTLYFTSRGHEGMGGADLFMSRKQADGSWGAPINLGYPINTPGDEIGIYVSTDGRYAYFASEQPDTKGGMDIYRFSMPENLKPYTVTYVKGKVFDKEANNALGAKIQFVDLATNVIYTTASSDPKTGEYLVTLPAGKNYACQVSKEGYLFYSANFSLQQLTAAEPFKMDVALQKIKIGERVVLTNVFFESNSFDLKDESKTELNSLVELLSKNSNLKIEIAGHTDNSGIEKDNLTLSENRAKAVYNYLISKGGKSENLSYKGYGSSRPFDNNTSTEGKAKNRRTEFQVTSM